ncbi:MAG: hypothetical protein COV08_01780 [Candidatus Vogelbacteria bacterium CG10_big_fil_rev_8_21_14_0_10_49_38]|uniref:Transmembrane protein n=1 Tax=Candidatus Vogelbacteria bacterium CG10_big_fil_rev_8_21_14_0_10_49_38 TaxID=1975043 RepID=A0A2H0RJ47_9BACT|nr:MAG: hypothetical protein BK006_01795 [bacterium CG10_49_38]PIR46044.1 MAG: hypothetical protein COV08_01780 [Candidatus Vogelbacteria bacterium CG10_big_fil_rev_8_21_14_0_10_49_38]
MSEYPVFAPIQAYVILTLLGTIVAVSVQHGCDYLGKLQGGLSIRARLPFIVAGCFYVCSFVGILSAISLLFWALHDSNIPVLASGAGISSLAFIVHLLLISNLFFLMAVVGVKIFNTHQAVFPRVSEVVMAETDADWEEGNKLNKKPDKFS